MRISFSIVLPILLLSPNTNQFGQSFISNPTIHRFYHAKEKRRIHHGVVCHATRLPEVTAMRPSDLRKELRSYGINVMTSVGRDELIDAVLKARADGIHRPYIHVEQPSKRNTWHSAEPRVNNVNGPTPKVRSWPNVNSANPSAPTPNNVRRQQSINQPEPQRRPMNTAGGNPWKPHAYVDDFSVPYTDQQQAQYFQGRRSQSSVNGDMNYKAQQRNFRPNVQYEEQQYNGPYYNANIRDHGINDGTQQYNYGTERQQKFSGNTYIPRQQPYPPPYQQPYDPPPRRPHRNEPAAVNTFNNPNQQRYRPPYQPPYEPPQRRPHRNEPPAVNAFNNPNQQRYRSPYQPPYQPPPMTNEQRYQTPYSPQQVQPPQPPPNNRYPRQPDRRYRYPRQPQPQPQPQQQRRRPPPQTPQQRYQQFQQEQQQQYQQQFYQYQQYQQPTTSSNPPNQNRQWNGAMSPDTNSYQKVNNQSWQTEESLHEEILKSFIQNQQEGGDDDREFFTAKSYTDSSKTKERQDMVNKEWLKCQDMDLQELVEELLELGISVDDFKEKSQFVKALVNARVEEKWKETSDYDEKNPWKKVETDEFVENDTSHEKREDYDPSYRDVGMKKMKIKPSSLKFGTSALIDIQITDAIIEEDDEEEQEEERDMDETIKEVSPNLDDEENEDQVYDVAGAYSEISDAASQIAVEAVDEILSVTTDVETE